ncbi:glycosyltransferase family 2 protein [Marivita sp. GX14005]|uniref:glycosyltransferase family 2 protein n=1 Tax=Marivita sp. GX14005 TaxID=2942276 RepID=UPI00201989A1|nr:glycosyltransferase family 2 protein [Marivita sp. GX14005]MCL3881767.1 glycosyltransferase family 2 protein [Marivita sp. GX14005]
MTDIVAVILNYKTPDLALKAARSVAAAMEGFGGAILLVDNASGDGSFEAMRDGVARAKWPAHLDLRVLQTGRNGGFGAGNNFGIRAGLETCPGAKFVYLLNPDAEVEAGGIAALVNHLEMHPEAAIAGSWISGEDGGDHCSAFRLPSLASEFEAAIRMGPVTRVLKNSVLPLHVPDRSGPVGWIVGASMLVRRDALDRTGLFDETFFLYFEETDLCLRAQRAGFEVHFVRESRVSHIGSVSTGMGSWARTPPYWYQSRWYYYSKNHGRVFAAAATLLNVTGTLLWRLRRRIERRPNTDAPRFLRDMIAHDARALFKPTPNAAIRSIRSPAEARLQTSMD